MKVTAVGLKVAADSAPRLASLHPSQATPPPFPCAQPGCRSRAAVFRVRFGEPGAAGHAGHAAQPLGPGCPHAGRRRRRPPGRPLPAGAARRGRRGAGVRPGEASAGWCGRQRCAVSGHRRMAGTDVAVALHSARTRATLPLWLLSLVVDPHCPSPPTHPCRPSCPAGRAARQRSCASCTRTKRRWCVHSAGFLCLPACLPACLPVHCCTQRGCIWGVLPLATALPPAGGPPPGRGQ